MIQAAAHVRRTLLDVGGVVLEDYERSRIVQRERPAEGGMQHVRGHSGVVLVNKPTAGAHERSVAYRRMGLSQRRLERVPRHYLLEQRAGACVLHLGCAGYVAHVPLAEAQQTSRLIRSGGPFTS